MCLTMFCAATLMAELVALHSFLRNIPAHVTSLAIELEVAILACSATMPPFL